MVDIWETSAPMQGTFPMRKFLRPSPFFLCAALALGSTLPVVADDALVTSAAESASTAFEKRISGRAAGLVAKLQLADEATAGGVATAVTRFYRELNAAHSIRDSRISALAAVESAQLHRIQFEAEKQIQAVYGGLIGSLALLLDARQVEAVKNGMTFDMVPLSLATYARMFPTLSGPQSDQLRTWLVDAREMAVTAGSAETKLDVFRVNKMRMHAYLAAQGFDVDAALKAEDDRKAAEKKVD
jgi:hypothetical protein